MRWASLWLLLLTAALHAAEPLVIERLDGPPTARELAAFAAYMRDVPVPTTNLRNALVYGGGGTAVEALGRVFEFTGDQALLDRMLAFTDRLLAARNDPRTGALIWTGERELVWPNQVPVDGRPLYSATENGDVVGHIAYAAQLILQTRRLWDQPVAGGDPCGFGKTYRERAARYVRELDRTVDNFLLKWLVRPDTQRYWFPKSAAYEAASRPGAGDRPVPWNQQMMLNNGFQRLAAAHSLLGDDPERVKRYEAIVQTSLDWFFASVERVTVQEHVCYKWGYVAETPLVHIEDAGHGGYDVGGLCRAWRSGRYALTAEQLRPLANTVLYVMRTPEGTFIPRVDGRRNAKDHPPGGLGAPWLDLCEFAPELLPLLYERGRGRLRSSPELVATLLWHKHRLAATRP